MSDVNNLVREIAEILSSDNISGHPLSSIAADYAKFCTEANQRLEQCAVMLEKGSEYQALQLAETEPVLLDLVNTLSFNESGQWREFCKTNELQVADRIDSKSVKAVNALYTKGISASHPLYKDYRAAVTARKDDEALRIIKMIVRLNPRDANAKSELLRLENKLFQEKLRDLRRCLQTDDNGGVLKVLDQLERIAPGAKLAENSDYNKATVKRKEVLRNKAISDSHRYVTQLSEYHASDDWQRVGDLVARIRASQTQHHFELPQSDEQIAGRMEACYLAKRTEAIQNAKFEEAVSVLKQQIVHAEHASLNRGGLKLYTARNEFNELNSRYRDVELFGKGISEEMQTRLKRVAGALKSELDRLQRQRRLTIGLGCAAAIALLITVTFFVYGVLQARDFSEQITRLMQTKQVTPTAKLITDVQSAHKTIADKPILRAKIAEAENWIKNEREKREAVDRAVSELESVAQKDFADAVPLNVHKQLQTVSADIGNLAVDLKLEPEARLATIRNKFEAKVATLRSANQKAMEELLQATEAATGAQLSFDKSVAELVQSLNRLEPDLKRLSEFTEPGVEELNPPADLLVRATALKSRVETVQKELEKLEHANEQVRTATSFDAYQHALEGFRDSLFVRLELVKRARTMLSSFPKTDDILAKLLLPDDAAAWTAAKSDKSDPSLIPPDVFPAELSKLLALRDDDNLRDIWEATYVDHEKRNGSRIIYSRGEITPPGEVVVGDRTLRTWRGSFYDPAKSPDALRFTKGVVQAEITPSVGMRFQELTNIRRSSTSSALDNLELQHFIDDNGTKFQKSILSVLDVLVKQKEANPLFKAYAMQQINELIRLRPFAWGLQWCPAVRQDFETLQRLSGDYHISSEDWMLQKRNNQWSSKFAAFFNGISTHSYLAHARANCDLIRTAERTGLTFAGYIDENGTPRLLGDAKTPKDLWALSRDSGVPVKLPARMLNNGEIASEDANIAAFSPVFYIRIDSSKLLAEVSQKLAVNLNDSAFREQLPLYFKNSSH